MYEATDVITCIGHNNFTTAMMANKDFFDGLGEDEQMLIQNATDAAFEYILSYQQELGETSFDNILKAKPGMEINILSDEERAPFMATSGPVEAAFVEMAGDRGEEILNQLKADLAAAEEATN